VVRVPRRLLPAQVLLVPVVVVVVPEPVAPLAVLVEPVVEATGQTERDLWTLLPGR